MATETLTHVYTSEAELKRQMSHYAVESYLSDLSDVQSEQPDYWNELIADATDIINQFLEAKYKPEDLVTSRWVRNRATWIAGYFLTQRRGDGPAEVYARRYEELTDPDRGELARVQQGKIRVPRLSPRFNNLPAMSNYVIDDTKQNKVRVRQGQSVGESYSGQPLDDYLGWED